MALVKMKTLLENAAKNNRGCGAFSVGNMEMVKGAIRAAEELDTPIILQIAEVRLKHSPLDLMGPMMVQAAKSAKVDVAVHLDHGLTFETVQRALELGFTSVMLDASTLPFEENIANTRKVVELAAEYGATVEAELGLVGGSEDGSCDHGIRCTDRMTPKYLQRRQALTPLPWRSATRMEIIRWLRSWPLMCWSRYIIKWIFPWCFTAAAASRILISREQSPLVSGK